MNQRQYAGVTSCNKNQYRTQAEAERHACYLENESGYKTNAYRCKRCGAWHVGRYRSPEELAAFFRRRTAARRGDIGTVAVRPQAEREWLREQERRRMRTPFEEVPRF